MNLQWLMDPKNVEKNQINQIELIQTPEEIDFKLKLSSYSLEENIERLQIPAI